MDKVNIKNKKAFHEFQILDKYVAGIQLKGTEIKSIREGKANLSDGFCYFNRRALYVRNMHIGPYARATVENHEPKRARKLLLKKQELHKLEGKIKERGFTIVPLRLFIANSGYAKLEIALAKGKKIHDKRETLKRKDMERQMKRELRNWKK